MKEAEVNQEASQAVSNICETDLRAIPMAELLNLKDRIDRILAEADFARMGQDDLLLEYDVKLLKKDGEGFRNSGSTRLNSILAKRLVAAAPGRLEEEFSNQVFGPVNAHLYDIIDERNPENGSMASARGMLPAYMDNDRVFDPSPDVIMAVR